MTYTQDNRLIQILTPLGKDVLLLRGYTAEEGISIPFQFNFRFYSENYGISLGAIMGKKITLKIILADKKERYINGIVNSFSQSGSSSTFAYYEATMVPWLWLLTRTSDCRIFQDKSVPDIIEQVFKDLGFTDFKFRLYGEFIPRQYCVQYRETDFNFVSRLMEEEGIFYFFEHEKDKHILILANHPNEFKPTKYQPEADYGRTEGQRQTEDVVTDWISNLEIRPGKYTHTDFNFEQPSLDLRSQITGKDPLQFELYDYPGEYQTRDEGDRLAGLRIQEQDLPLHVITGGSICRGFMSGFRFDLKQHYRRDFNRAYVITMMHHSAEQGENFRSSEADASQEFRYVNTFQCLLYPIPFRPPRMTPIPVVHGTQTAIVVGPPGEEIFTDQYGRVKVQFHWDRVGTYDEKSSCWIRVATFWAGSQWGGIHLPRVGQEVIVDFLEGDPDKPIIIGSVYNGEQMPPYPLPDHKTRSTVKSRSTLKGGPQNFNELRFEDKKGSEQVFFHAEKDLDLRVKKDSRAFVEGARHEIVKGEHREAVSGEVSLQVGTNRSTKIGTIDAVEAGQEIHLKAGSKVVIEAGAELTIKAGGGFISIGPQGIAIQGATVLINSGGSAHSGSGASPKDPDTADDGSKGTKLNA